MSCFAPPVFPGPTRISAAPEPLETPTAVCTHIDARCKCIFCHPLACVECARAMYAKGHRKSAAAVSDFERALLPDVNTVKHMNLEFFF
jgi:hypothetical protein